MYADTEYHNFALYEWVGANAKYELTKEGKRRADPPPFPPLVKGRVREGRGPGLDTRPNLRRHPFVGRPQFQS
jgi:hypothetical protein